MPNMRILVAFFVVLGAGCTSSAESRCVSQESAEVCIAGSSGDFKVEARGLQPGSALQLTSDKLGDSSYTITDAGEPEGQVGLLGDLDGEVIVISAVAESGEPLSGELTG
jgi:hypothetical protein